MSTRHGPIASCPRETRCAHGPALVGAHLEVVLDRRHLAVEGEAEAGLCRPREPTSSRRSTRRSRKRWNGSYHSRSQWVCGTSHTVVVMAHDHVSRSGRAPGKRRRAPRAACRVPRDD